MKYDCSAMEGKMKKSVESFDEMLKSIRASQASPAVLSKVTFEYYGAPTKIVDMAGVTLSDARTLVITPYDASTLKAIEKAILTSDVGITPNNDGRVIRLTFPQLTEERRVEISKKVTKLSEDAKVAIRNIRRDANDDCKKQKKDGILTEDEEAAGEKSIQELTDKYIKDIDAITAKKNKEIMAI